MKMSFEDYHHLHGWHICRDGYKWIVEDRSKDGFYHGFIFNPAKEVLAHFYHLSYSTVESQLHSMLKYYRAGTDYVTKTLNTVA